MDLLGVSAGSTKSPAPHKIPHCNMMNAEHARNGGYRHFVAEQLFDLFLFACQFNIFTQWPFRPAKFNALGFLRANASRVR